MDCSQYYQPHLSKPGEYVTGGSKNNENNLKGLGNLNNKNAIGIIEVKSNPTLEKNENSHVKKLFLIFILLN